MDADDVAVDDSAIETLLAAYAAGDSESWEPLFERLAPRLLAYFQRSLKDAAFAEIYVQATFVQLHRARREYRPGTPVRPWVFAIASRVRVDRNSEAAVAKRATRASAPGENARDRQVREAIESLAINERSLIHLHRFERMNFEQIAQVLGWSEATVEQRALHAYRQLRQRLWTLSDDGEGP